MIVLATLNAKYIHASFGLRYLLANLGALRPAASLLEFDIQQRPIDIVEAILAREPGIVGLGVYIWNVSETTEVVAALKRIRPETIVIVGGPEVSFEVEEQEIARLADNLRFLRRETGVHVHADLIAGLPGETLETFGAGFDRLVALGPQEIQVGILKRLRGTPIVRHDQTSRMVYSAHPPYEILRNNLMDFALMQRLRRFARFWDLVGNSGNFVETAPLLWNGGASPFAAFMKWSDWLYARLGRQHAIALARLAELLFEYLTRESGVPHAEVARCVWRDWQRAGRREKPDFIMGFLSDIEAPQVRPATVLPKRQARHLRAVTTTS